MGKKSKEKAGGEPSSSGIFTSLFTADNPFRRKPQSDNPPTQPKQQVESIPDLAVEVAEAKKKKKREREKSANIVAEPEFDPNGTDSDVFKKNKTEGGEAHRKKRKRREIEEEYEMSMYGAGAVEMEENVKERRELDVAVGQKRKAEDEAKEMVVRKESFDDESKLLRTVFVGNLPLKTKRKALLKEFAGFGEIESIRIRSVPIVDTKAPRKAAILKGKINDAIDSVHAYIVYEDEKSAQAALAHNMAKIGGNHIRVDMACPPRKKMKGEAPIYSVKKTVFVGNLPYDVKDEELYQLFCEANQLESSVEAIRVIRDPQTSFGKGIAYVLFKTREAANSVVKKELKLRDRELRLSHARPDSTPSKNITPSKRKNQAPRWTENSNKRTAASSAERDYKPKVKTTSLSYQGLRASKSGVHKKAPRSARRVNLDTRKSAPTEDKVRKGKRPAVAARKANALKQIQKKRKSESGTPENPRRSKKARH